MLILKYLLSDQACADKHQGNAIARPCGCPHKIQASNLQSAEAEHELQDLMTFDSRTGTKLPGSNLRVGQRRSEQRQLVQAMAHAKCCTMPQAMRPLPSWRVNHEFMLQVVCNVCHAVQGKST